MKRFWGITIIVIGIILPLMLLWYACLHPFVSRLIFKPDYYDGVSYYNNEEYLEFDNVELLSEFLSDYAMTNKSKVADFHYGDTSAFDNPFYGKFHDIYVVDFKCSAKECEALKEKVDKQSNKEPFAYGDYVLYVLPVENLSPKYDCYKAIAFCDETNIVRFVMLPETDRKQTTYADDIFFMIINYYWDERWESEWHSTGTQGQGDGSPVS